MDRRPPAHRANRHPIVSMVAGLSVGFCGAGATIAGVEWLADGSQPVVAAVLGEPDFVRYCSDRDLRYVEVGVGDERHRCAGSNNGTWRVEPVVPEAVCLDQFGTPAQSDPDLGWICVDAP